MPECNDKKCPIHGSVKVRGDIFAGKVIGDKQDKTVKVERILTRYIPKYERYKKTRSVIAAHNPGCIGAKVGEFVRIGETRKLSKTKSFVVLEKMKEKSE